MMKLLFFLAAVFLLFFTLEYGGAGDVLVWRLCHCVCGILFVGS